MKKLLSSILLIASFTFAQSASAKLGVIEICKADLGLDNEIGVYHIFYRGTLTLRNDPHDRTKGYKTSTYSAGWVPKNISLDALLAKSVPAKIDNEDRPNSKCIIIYETDRDIQGYKSTWNEITNAYAFHLNKGVKYSLLGQGGKNCGNIAEEVFKWVFKNDNYPFAGVNFQDCLDILNNKNLLKSGAATVIKTAKNIFDK